MSTGEKLEAWIASIAGGLVIGPLILILLGIDLNDVSPIILLLLCLGGSRVIIEIWFRARKHWENHLYGIVRNEA